jgi:RNA polymerase sigma-70 factor (ECF subfamily)
MQGREENDITAILARWRSGDAAAANELAELVYRDLHRLAAREMRHERGEHTLQTTALLHEAYLRILRPGPVEWKDRAHFFAFAAQQLRRVLVDHARRSKSEKRGGDVVKFSLLDSDGGGVPAFDARLFALNEALTRLEELDPRAVRVVELRYFAGLTEAEAADVLGVSVATLKRDWDFAKTWLAAQLA